MLATRLPLRTAIAVACLLGSVATARADNKTCIGTSEEGQRQRADKKLVAAKDLFDSCSQSTCPKIVRDDCVGWAKEVDALLPTVVFAVRDRSGKDVVAASVLVDGSSSHIADGTPVQLDPGQHRLQVTAGERKQELTLNVMEGEKNRRVVFTVEDAPKAAAPVDPGTTSQATEKGSVPLAPLVVGGASIVVIGVGVFFQLTAMSEDSKSRDYVQGADQEVGAKPACIGSTDSAQCPYAAAVHSHHDAAKNDQALALPLMGVGAGALIVSGVFLYVLWPKAPAPRKAWLLAPSVGAGNVSPSGLVLRGTF